jgi:regulator of CtrA degradation
MGTQADINPRIIETLYCEGLMLSDEVRMAFDLTDPACRDPEDLSRIALSCEALRTTTRMMHAIAWLLNHRAFFRGEISAFQLHHHSRLKADFPTADPKRMALIAPEVCELIETTEQFYARLVRLDLCWRDDASQNPPVVARLQEQLKRLAQ